MNNKERLLNAISGKSVDRIPWSPFLTYFWESQKAEIRGMGEIVFLKEIGATPLIRGHYPTVKAVDPYKDMYLFDVFTGECDIRETVCGNEKVKTYTTKVGTLTSRYVIDPQSNSWFLVEYPLKEIEDYKTLQYLMEQTVLVPNFREFEELSMYYGEEALFVPILVPGSKTAFQALIEHWAGTEALSYMLLDETVIVEETIESIKRVSQEAVKIAADSSAEVFLTWEDSSTTNYSPWMYEKYVIPEINQWCDVLHTHGKLYMQHACGHIKALLPLIAESGIDCLESVTPTPTGNVEMSDVVAVLPERISIVGGIDPIILLTSDLDALEEHVINLLDVMKGRSYVLANSDSCPPGVAIEKFKMISTLVW